MNINTNFNNANNNAHIESRAGAFEIPCVDCNKNMKVKLPVALLNFLYWDNKRTIINDCLKVKLATLVKGDPKAPFSIVTTPRCRRGCYSFPWIAPLYPYLIMLSVKQGGIKYHFWVLDMTRPGIEYWSPGPLANTLLIRPITRTTT